MTSTPLDGSAGPPPSPLPVDTQADSFRDESHTQRKAPLSPMDPAAVYDLLLDIQNRLGEHAALLHGALHSLEDAAASLVILRDHVVDRTPLRPEL